MRAGRPAEAGRGSRGSLADAGARIRSAAAAGGNRGTAGQAGYPGERGRGEQGQRAAVGNRRCPVRRDTQIESRRPACSCPTKVICRQWKAGGVHGSIVNMASMGSYRAAFGGMGLRRGKGRGSQPYAAAAKEFAPHGIRVNAIAPGFFLGKQNRALLIDEKTGRSSRRAGER